MKNRASITGNEKETLVNQIRGVDPATTHVRLGHAPSKPML
jgi:hypothetical protein